MKQIIALYAFIKGSEHYRQIVVVDDSHLKGMYTGCCYLYYGWSRQVILSMHIIQNF